MSLSKPAELPEPSATGTLAKKPLAHLLIYALDRKLTGTFELAADGGTTVHVVVAGGGVSRVATSESVTYLGHVLYELGYIDDTLLSLSLAEVAASKRLHGQVLRGHGEITAEQLAEALRQQRARKLQSAFALPPTTTFAFYADVDLVGERQDDPEPMDPLTCIWRSVREHPSWDHVRATIARVGGRPLRLLDSATLERFGMDDDERTAAECLRLKPATVAELAIVGGLTIQQTNLLSYFLVIAKQVELVDRVGTTLPPGGVRPSAAPVQISAQGVVFASGEYTRKISFTMNAVTPDAGTLRIPSPVPDGAGTTPSTMPGRLSSPLPARRMSPMPGGSSPPAARITSPAPRGSSQFPPPARAASTAPARASSRPPPGSVPPGSMPPTSDLARKKSIVDRAKWIDQEDYFKMLTVQREASTEEIRAAFLRAAKVWHPDTLPLSIIEVRGDCEKVFLRITQAYETLVDPGKRRAYERSISRQVRENHEADQLLSQAEMHVTLGDRAAAEGLVRKALVASPGFPEAMALLAYLEAFDSRKGHPDHLHAALKMIDMAIGKDPMCKRAHFYRAELRKRVEDHEGAIRDLRTAVTNDPDDVDAQRELRLYEKKIRDGTIELRSLSPSGGTKRPEGFFERLRKK
jgi:hypothetical protein